MISPMQAMQMIRSGTNPQQLMASMIQQRMGDSPMSANLIRLIQSGDTQALEQIARNLCAQRGMNFESEFANFRRTLGV